MHSLKSTLVLILSTFLAHSCSAQSNATEPSIEAITSPRLIASNSTISLRGEEVAKNADNFTASRRNAVNRFDADTNPDGLVNLGTAENFLVVKDVVEFVNKNLSIETKDFTYLEGSGGTARLRNATANFLNLRFNPYKKVDPNRLLYASGVTGIIHILGLTIGDPGDGILFSRPIYAGFQYDFGTIGKIKPVFVEFDGIDQFSPAAVPKYEKALVEAQKKGIRVRALTLCHPHNPLGRYYPRETLIAFLKLANKYKIHVISDEIYALSIYDNPASAANPLPFHSILSLDVEKYIDPKYLQFIYGFSKDIAASGIRLGFIYSLNDELLQALSGVSFFHWSGNPNERIALRFLEDEKWLDGFLRLSRARLAAGYRLAGRLLENEGVQYLKGSNAGFFLWVDLRPYLSTASAANATIEDRWEAEAELSQKFRANNVTINAGKGFASAETGWFRLIFSQEEKTIREGLKRVFEVLKDG